MLRGISSWKYHIKLFIFKDSLLTFKPLEISASVLLKALSITDKSVL